MSLRDAAETAITQCLALEETESCCIVTDDKREEIGEALYDVASEVTDDATIIRFPPGAATARNRPNPSRRRWPPATCSSRRRPRV